METLCKALRDYFREDEIRPGVVVSYLGPNWYGSIIRYHRNLYNKQVITNTKADSLNEVVEKLKTNFGLFIGQGPDTDPIIQELLNDASIITQTC